MREHLSSVRVRITVAATLVAGIAVLVAGAWLVHGVQGSLTAAVRDADRAELDRVATAVEAGSSINDALTLPPGVDGNTAYVQAVIDGQVVAASPAAKGLGLLDPNAGIDARTSVEGGPRIDSAGGYTVTSVDANGPAGEIRLVAASPLGPVQHSVDAVRHGLLVVLPLLVAAVGGLTWFLTGRALRPVEGIRREVEAISGSTLERRVPVSASGDEVSRLATTMNAMLDRLEAAAMRQQQFVADASHELRSPVASIRTELEVAQLLGDDEAWPAVVERLLGEEARLEAVITDLLLLATLDERAPRPPAEELDLAVEVRVEVARRNATATTDGPTITLDAPDPVVVRGRAVQLRRVIVNLLDNAVRHAHGAVVVTVRTVDHRAELVVDDDGHGIASEDRERVFDRFTRLDGHRVRGTERTEGAGLGLSLVRSIAQGHGGRAWVEEAPTGGARLVVELRAAE